MPGTVSVDAPPSPHAFLCQRLASLFEFLRALGHASAQSLEGYKTVLIFETTFWMAGASESMKINRTDRETVAGCISW